MNISVVYTALLHSLWLGILMAGLCALVMQVTKKSQAHTRYNLLLACLALFVLAETGLIIYQLNHLSAGTPLQVTGIEHYAPGGFLAAAGHFFMSLLQGLSRYADWIVALWMLVVVAKSLSILAGIQKIYFLKTRNVSAAGNFWDSKVAGLAQVMGLKQSIRVLQSGIAKMPMVVGHLKPVILLPVGLLNGLSVVEVEAILNHELAHIKRYDYLVNMLQTIVETLFFFNPMVLWVSNLIKTERENCCDDMTLENNVSKKDYIRAMLYCAESEYKMPLLAAGLGGDKNNLLDRTKRILSERNHVIGKKEKTVLALLLSAGVMLLLTFAGASNWGQRSRSETKHNTTTTTKIVTEEKDKTATAAPAHPPQEKDAGLPAQRPAKLKSEKRNTTITTKIVTEGADKTDAVPAHHPQEQDASLSGQILAELKSDGLIGTVSHYSYELNDHELIVNDTRQRWDIQKKYQKKYLKEPGTVVRYSQECR